MIIRDLENYETEYFKNHNEQVLPDLVATYYEQREYEIVCYFARKYREQYSQFDFYYMMSLMELGYQDQADNLYNFRGDDWFQECKRFQIHWSHVVLFALYFKVFNISDYYMDQFDLHYDYDLVQLLEYVMENEKEDITNHPLFDELSKKFPVLRKVWSKKEKKKREIKTFETIQWSEWKKENVIIGNGNFLGIEKVYEDTNVEIYSYKPKQVAASMHIIRDHSDVVILDCGCELSDGSAKRIPIEDILQSLNIDKVDAVFISHAHMDHYGSLNELRGTPVYMTEQTKQLIRCVSPEVYLSKTTVVPAYSTISVSGIDIRFVPNGHIKGSCMFDINWKNQLRIVFTGDFSVENQLTVDGFCVDDLLDYSNKRIDVLLTETTYGNKADMFTLRQYEKIFLTLCEKYLESGNKIIIPCFAVGRAQEAALLLKDMVNEKGWRILIDGLAAQLTDVYQSLSGENQKILSKNITVCHNEFDYTEKIENNEIILASSGMLKPGSTSANYMNKVINREGICVMKVGFIHESEHLLQSIIKRSNTNLSYVDLSLSAHAGYGDLVNTIEKLSPNHVIYVHGSGIHYDH